MPATQVVTYELARYLSELSHEIGRQVGVLIDRTAGIDRVLVGDARRITIPELRRARTGPGRLAGVRVIHTRLGGEGLTKEDLTDLALLRLDLMGVIDVGADGLPGQIHLAHLLPPNPQNENWRLLPPTPAYALDLDFAAFIHALEDEIARAQGARDVGDTRPRALLVSVTTDRSSRPEASLEELKELARSDDIVVLDAVLQRRQRLDPSYLVGRGKLDELIMQSLRLGADLLVFDQDLTPAQARSISDAARLRVIDRTQLILDIFARRAQSRDGKLQVELAQLRYTLPRLAARDGHLSRLGGGIGTRGPGETKLEADRRRIRRRIQQLEREIEALSRGRAQRRARREAGGLPVLSIVGYTNAGKSTLLNRLTNSQVVAEDRLFATLDPTARRLRFPEAREAIVTDTVGFIRDLPKDLVAAFRATLEELAYADLLLHVVDVSNPDWPQQRQAVEAILEELGLGHLPRLLVFNKQDRLPPGEAEALARLHGAVAISAARGEGLDRLLHAIEEALWPRRLPTPAECVLRRNGGPPPPAS
ncbi:MAG TPA: GTPase HflX [Thermodesulfobacteriota bacterium]|nr:GTPase HflX [Thermodesulfobacteriota bacterium]